MNKKYRWFVIFLFLFICCEPPSSAQLNVAASKALIHRIVLEVATQFEVEYIPAENNKDVFEVESIDGKIILRGNNGVSVASALNYYLRHYCHCLITWNGINLDLPDELPAVDEMIHKVTPYKYRYYLNYCTFSYSMSWWNWDRWQREIDWMALNGINMPLASTGETAILQKVYKDMGFSDSELNAFFSGPAFFAWFDMNNLDAWGGPLPQSWIDAHEVLQKKILARERSLGMTPVLPAFTGHVPPTFKKRFPESKVNQVKWGTNFPAVNLLSPLDSLFTIIGKKFIEVQTKQYGTDHFYSSDVFNEMTPPSSDSLYLDNISKKVYKSMYNADTLAVWVMQGWLFHFEKQFWKSPQIKAMLNGVPDDKMILLDLWSETNPMWKSTKAYYGKRWIWNMLHNFGGRVYLGGCMPCVVHQPVSLIGSSESGDLVGLGLTMEAIEQNPVLYQLMLDNIWRNKPVDLNRWIVDYVHQRYGSLNRNAIRAWRLLQHSVYAQALPDFGGENSVITMRPKLLDFKDEKGNWFSYSYDSLLLAWKYFIQASTALSNNDGFQYDLVNTGRQVLVNYAILLEQKLVEAYQSKNISEFEQLSKQFLTLIDDLDKLLGTREGFLLGKWLQSANSWATNPEEKKLYEFNARNLITLWGNKNSTLHDYARKQWSGLLSGFYKPRWEKFFDYALDCLHKNQPIAQKAFEENIKDWEWKWVNGNQLYADTVKGNPVKVSMEMYNKYYEDIFEMDRNKTTWKVVKD